MKKLISLVLSTLLLTTSLTCFAADNTSSSFNAETEAALATATQYAYLDLNSATPDMQEKILAARDTIIFSKDWVADGYEAHVEDIITGEIIEVLPSFSELFPDWDLPVDDIALLMQPESNILETISPATSITPASANTWLRLGSTSYYLHAASNTQNASPFASFFVNPFDMGTSIRSYATALTSSETCNIGYSNASTGTSLGYKTRLARNEAFVINNVGGMNLSIRASTYSIPGYATMAVDGANRILSAH